MNKLFVVGDVHGKFDMLEHLLKNWNPDSELLVFLGDYIDRGYNSYDVIRLVVSLREKYGAVALGGNHESMFLDWIDNPEDYWFAKWVENESMINYHEEIGNSISVAYYANGGNKTIDSFYNSNVAAYRYLPSVSAKYIKDNFPHEIAFLRSLPDYFEWKDYVCVHAGVNLNYVDWKKSSQDEFRWIRRPFHFMPNETDKKFIFGHTPTLHLHHDSGNCDIWFSPCKTKIGIDGAAVFGGLLHGVVVCDDELIVNSVSTNLESAQKTIKIRE